MRTEITEKEEKGCDDKNYVIIIIINIINNIDDDDKKWIFMAYLEKREWLF